MPTTLTTPAIERSTYAFLVSFLDDAGAAVVPTTAQWTLLKKSGIPLAVSVVRGPVTITPLATTYTVVLSGDDLALTAAERDPPTRYVLVEWTYSSSLGTGLPGKDQIIFTIQDLTGLPA